MNREIKFRAWDGERMLEPFSIWHLLNNYNSEYADARKDISKHNFERNEEMPILMQYTGIKDKNGKEIYEGDILERGSEGATVQKVVEWSTKLNQSIGFNVGCPKKGVAWRIIGNIYENPDLLTLIKERAGVE